MKCFSTKTVTFQKVCSCPPFKNFFSKINSIKPSVILLLWQDFLFLASVGGAKHKLFSGKFGVIARFSWFLISLQINCLIWIFLQIELVHRWQIQCVSQVATIEIRAEPIGSIGSSDFFLFFTNHKISSKCSLGFFLLLFPPHFLCQEVIWAACK